MLGQAFFESLKLILIFLASPPWGLALGECRYWMAHPPSSNSHLEEKNNQKIVCL